MAHKGRLYERVKYLDFGRFTSPGTPNPKRWLLRPLFPAGPAAVGWTGFAKFNPSDDFVEDYTGTGSLFWHFPPPATADPTTHAELLYELTHTDKMYQFRLSFWKSGVELGYIQKHPGNGVENWIGNIIDLNEAWVLHAPSQFTGFSGDVKARRWDGTPWPP